MPVSNNNLTKIFVYGTLKRSQPNHDELASRNAIFVDQAITVDKWPLIVGTEANLPFLLYNKDIGHHIKGELFMVDDETVAFLDIFEDVHQGFYSKKKVLISCLSNNIVHEADCYVLENCKPFLIENSKKFMEEYDWYKNKENYEYAKHLDTRETARTLAAQVKILK